MEAPITSQEAAIDPKALERAVQNALENYFPRLESNDNARAEFFKKFKYEADKYDNDLSKRCSSDLDTASLFAGLFSAVTSAFIVAVETKLEPDYTRLSYNVLTVIADANLGTIPPGQHPTLPQWTGPDPTLVHVQSILFSSLAASLLSAFVALLGKQWLNRYFHVDMRGAPIDRSRDQQRKRDGMTNWRFKLVTESLPVMLQASLLLLSWALSEYLFTVNNLVAWVVVGFTAAGFLFHSITVVAAILSYECPFQTPLSLIIRSMFSLEYRKYLDKYNLWLYRMFPRERGERRQGPRRFTIPDRLDGNNGTEHFELPTHPPHLPPVLFDLGTDRDGYVLDSKCIAWMFEMSMDSDVIPYIMKLIPEIIWHNGIQTTPLEKLYDVVLECFDHSSGSLVVTSNLRDRAYFGAKALAHLGIQRKCIGNESDTAAFESIARRHLRYVGSTHYYDGDSDLEYTLGMIDRVFGDHNHDPAPMRWHQFAFTSSHHAWMSHILLYRAWSTFQNGENLPHDVKEFVLYSLRQVPAVAAPIISDCLSITGLVLGIQLYGDQKLVINKSKKIQAQIHKIYVKLFKTFEKTSPTAAEVDRALEAMRLIAPLSEEDIAIKSYSLFRILMKAPVSPAYTQEKKWEAYRLALHGAYKWDNFLPLVEDPRDILTFLSHHFELADRGEDQGEPIQNALRALAYALNPQTIDTFKNFDPTQPSFIRGICFAFQAGQPRELRKAALFFLPLVADRLFNTSAPIMTTDEMKTLCENWASAVDEIGHSAYLVQKVALAVLLDMMNSPHWRPHIVPKEWKLLERFTSAVPDDSEPLKRCLDNTELLGAISNMGNPDAMSLWSLVLWLRYAELKPEVQVQLKEVTKGVQKWDFERYLEAIEMEASKAENELTEYNPWTTDPGAGVLKTKIDNLRVAKESLMALKSGGR